MNLRNTPRDIDRFAARGGISKYAVLLFAMGFALLTGATVHAWERVMVLEAIHQVENPNDSMRIGRRGELGPFQFRPAVWHMYTQKPFELAADRAEAQLVAEQHFEWIKKGLERNKLEVTPYQIGLVWNAGLRATLNGRASAQSRYYAERVANLVEYAVKTAAAAPAATTPIPVEQATPPPVAATL